MSEVLHRWQWQVREQPLAPRAAVCWGEVAKRMHAQLGRLTAAQRKGLEATAGDDLLVVLGATELLPWIDGVEYAAPPPWRLVCGYPPGGSLTFPPSCSCKH